MDSLASLTAAPSIVNRKRVDDLIDIVCDPDRRCPVVVASCHPKSDFGKWREIVTLATRDLPGLASVYLLDPLAGEEFDDAIGSTHAVWGGAIRTYLSDVDPAVPEDGPRHRLLSAARVERDPEGAARILAALPRRLAEEAPLPAALLRVNRALVAQTQGIPISADIGSLRAQLHRLAEERNVAFDLAEEQQDRANQFLLQRDGALAELDESQQKVLALENDVRALRKRLVAAGKPDQAFLPAEAVPSPPATFADLLDWLDSDLPQVEFTGDRQAFLELDQSPESATWVRSSWEALRALEDYAENKLDGGFNGDFKTWCVDPPREAIGISSGRVARDESETVRTNKKFRRIREFAVPRAVDDSGKVFMGSHIRIGAAGRVSPRLHFHDATLIDGKVYVGYLGRHLTNTRT
jgi:hypothetical protein